MDRNKEDLGAKNQLSQSVQQKINTTMIGALASIEEIFGYLWRDGDPQNEQERALYAMFQEVRNNILDKGNRQKRLSAEDLDNYSITRNRYRFDFVVKPRKGE